MTRGDLLLTPGWHFHGHHNDTDQPMAWLDGLDIPFSHYTDVGFFEYGSERVTDEASPAVSRAERLWGYPGLRPLSRLEDTTSSPLAAYRWKYTDAALREQLALEDDGHPATVEQGHAAIRYVNPTTGGDVMPTLRAEFHRLRAGADTPTRHEVGSSVWQVFEGDGVVVLGGVEHPVVHRRHLRRAVLGIVVTAREQPVRPVPLQRRADHRPPALHSHLHPSGDRVKLATLRTSDGTVAVLVGTATATEISGVADVGALLKQ